MADERPMEQADRRELQQLERERFGAAAQLASERFHSTAPAATTSGRRHRQIDGTHVTEQST